MLLVVVVSAWGGFVVRGEGDAKLWSLRPVREPSIPRVADGSWPVTQVDRFILSKLESAGLLPAPDADRGALVRRLYFDLTGLPPTPGEVEAFVNDTSPAAIENLVDRLLDSPVFGERWGRHWLDVARFAESVGGGRTKVFDEAWRYRDYVIGAFNGDKPYDRFVTEQLAGDLLPYAELDEGRSQLVAATFLQLGPKNLDEQDKEQLTMDVVDEQLDTVGQAMLGLTIGCARCHDHKFDPIPARDYYALAGIFTSTQSLKHANVSEYLELPLPMTDGQRKLHEEHAAKVAAVEAKLKTAEGALAATRKDMAAIYAKLPGVEVDDEQAERIGDWKTSDSVRPFKGAGYRYTGDAGATARYRAVLEREGRYEVWVSHTPHENRTAKAKVVVKHAGGESEHAVNQKKPGTIGGMYVLLGVYEFKVDEGAEVVVSRGEAGGAEGVAEGALVADAVRFVPRPPAASADNAEGAFEFKELVRLGQQIKEAESGASGLKNELEALKKSAPPVPAAAMAVRDAEKPADTAIRLRGVAANHGEVVERGFLSAVPMMSKPVIPPERSGRLELASWMTSPDHPLTARVMVNRIWAHLMGEGLVRSVDNFGARGEVPSHPELLDYLASRFVAEGWSVKKTVRRVVLSRVYQVSSVSRGELRVKDPENRLLSRAHRRRLNAEALRDAMLRVSGELDGAMGGRTIEGKVQSEFDYHLKHASVRRSVYLPVFRNSLPGELEVFDFAEPNLVCGRRNVSTLPTQALFMLNSPFAADRAAAAAKRLISEGEHGWLGTSPRGPGSPVSGRGVEDSATATPDTARVVAAYRQTLGRGPTETERTLTLRFVERRRAAGGSEEEAWAGVYQTLFGCIDFRYLE